MGQKLGCPSLGTARPLTINEANAIGLKSHKGHDLQCDVDGLVSIRRVYRNGQTTLVAWRGSPMIAELHAHWAKPLLNPIHSPGGIRREPPPPQYPLRTVVSRHRSRTGLAIVEMLECHHTIRIKRSKAAMRTQRRCMKCPLQEAC